MDGKEIFFFQEMIRLAQYVGYSLIGFLSFWGRNLPVHFQSDTNKINILLKIEETSNLLRQIIATMEKLYQNSPRDVRSTHKISIRNHAISYLDEVELGHTNILFLSEELLSFFIHLIHTKIGLSSTNGKVEGIMLCIVDLCKDIAQTIKHVGNEDVEDKLFTQYLLEKKLISESKLQRASEIQNSINHIFGKIAINHGFILQEHVDRVLKVQSRIKKRFGELAIQMGILTEDQVNIVLKFQKEHYVPLRKILMLENILQEDLTEKEWDAFLKTRTSEIKVEELHCGPEVFSGIKESLLANFESIRNAFLQASSEGQKWTFRPGMIPFKTLIKLVYQNYGIMPPPLWAELLEAGLFIEGTQIGSFDNLLRSTKYFKREVLSEESVEKKLYTLRLFGDIRKFLENKLLTDADGKKLIPQDPRYDEYSTFFPSAPVSNTASRLSIVLVDDDPVFCEMVSEMIGKDKYQIQCFAAPSELLRNFEKLVADVILLDYSLPEINGLELLKIIKSKRPNVPIIIITSNASVQLGVSALKLGACDCLDKPISKKTLLEKIEEVYNSNRAKTGWSCSGILSATPLIEVLQICCTTQHSGKLLIQSFTKKVTIYFEKGQIIDAQYDNFKGFRALLRIGLIDEGSFEFISAPDSSHCRRTITADSMILLLEVARQRDEFRRLEKMLPGMDRKIHLAGAIPEGASTEVLTMLKERPLTIQKLLDICETPEIEVMNQIVGCLEKGLIKFVHDDGENQPV